MFEIKLPKDVVEGVPEMQVFGLESHLACVVDSLIGYFKDCSANNSDLLAESLVNFGQFCRNVEKCKEKV